MPNNSQEWLDFAAETTCVGLWDWDVRHDRLAADSCTSRRYGIGPDNTAVAGDIFARIVHPDDLPAFRAAAYSAGGHPTRLRIRLVSADGSVRPIDVTLKAGRGSTTHSPRLLILTREALDAIGATRDTTVEAGAAKGFPQQADSLQTTQRRLERASLSIQEGHWELELDTGKHWASKSYLAVLGYPEDSLELNTAEKVKAIIHPDDERAIQAATTKHLDEGLPYDLEARFRAADGNYRWFRLRSCAERDANGKPLRLLGSIYDVHKQRSAEDALRDVRARLTRAINGTPHGLWEVDLDRKTMWLSPRLSELLGYAEGELPETDSVLRDLLHPDDAAAADAAVQSSAEQNVSIDFEARMQTKTGEYRWYRVRGTPPIHYPGQGRRSSGSMQDVTERRARHDALIQATQTAQAANRAKSGFLANVSHEIRTPMNGIIGMARLLLDTQLDPTQRDYTDTIRSSADSLLTVINDILDFSKIEAGKLDIEALEMDLPANIEDIGSIMAFQAAAKNLEIIVNVHPDVPQHVLGDPQRIRQCIINLIGNAIKFTRSGEIVCEVGVVASGADTVDIRFAVSDTGIGIAPEILDALFQPFMQADASTTRHYGGTGLGLSIVHRLVEMMGGKTGVESEPGKGSTFWFVLPMPCAKAPADRAATRSSSAGRRLLIVDDNETNRRVLQSQLAYAGYEVTLACNGREALAAMRVGIAAAAPFDAALIDFQMPDMDGAVLGQTINSDAHLSRTRVVLLTSMDRHGDLARFAAMGFAGYLSKPLRMRDLFTCLERVLTRNASDWHLQTQPMVTPNVALQNSTAGRFSGKVLLVEDNVVNQKVARRFLERMGCEVTVAENGEEGVRAYSQGGYRLVLMDVQMPVMDGYTATRHIRDMEGTQTRIPIVALTANAMTGQLERCVEAGMDALLTKPLDVERLEEALDRFGLSVEPQSAPESAAAAPPLATPQLPPAIDLAQLRVLTDGDLEFATDLVQSYVNCSAELLAQVRTCIALDDRRQLAHAMHQLGGASANIQAAPLRTLCLSLEQAAQSADSAQLEHFAAQLTGEVSRVTNALTDPGNGLMDDRALQGLNHRA